MMAMIKVLLKKQWLATTAIFTQGKNGQRRSLKASIGFAILLLYGFVAMGAMFWEMADMMCAPLVHADLAWVYFAFVSLLATCIVVIVGIFTAKSTLYEAKDNDLLLSMPIPSWAVLLFFPKKKFSPNY